jgi:hypothetical protein
MTERLLQYIWQFQLFNKTNITTIENDVLQVLFAGTYNVNQGPDFSDGKIKIGKTTWVGNVELHVLSSHWKNHKHSADKNYNNVILHVVWQHDIDLKLPFATLVLQDKVPKILLDKYEALMQTSIFIPCERSIASINRLTFTAWKERLLIERLQQKATVVFNYLNQNNNHWEEVFWWMLAKNFGAKVNSDAFEKIAQSIPITVLAKHKNQIHQLEGLLLGQAGMLEGTFTEDYPKMLQREYNLYKAKYKLQKPKASIYQLRMRPANFPAVRLAQLAMLVHKSLHLFSKIKETREVATLKQLLNLTANDYWHYHYILDDPATFKEKNVGQQMIDNIIINTITVVLFAYGDYNKEEVYKDRALKFLDAVSGEKNSITNGFVKIGINIKSAFDSQALIQLKNNYCNHKRCLDCAVGNKLLQ